MTSHQGEQPALSPHGISNLYDHAVLHGKQVMGSGNRPIQLDNPEVVWFVERGAIDIFLVEHRDGEIVSSYRHLLRAGHGRLVFGVSGSVTPLHAVAKGLAGTRLRRLRFADVAENGMKQELADQVDAWLSEFSATVASQIDPRPHPDLVIQWGETLEVDQGQVLSTRPGRVVWVNGKGGTYLGTEDPPEDGTGLVPLTSESWLTSQGPMRLDATSSRDLSEKGTLRTALEEFHQLALSAEYLKRLLLLADEANEQVARATHRRIDQESARQRLYNVLGAVQPVAEKDDHALAAALGLIGRSEGIDFRKPFASRPADEEPSLQDILYASGVRGRRVRLTSEDRWWIGNSGAMLGFRTNGQPVALLPGNAGRYRLKDPVTGRSSRLNAALAEDLTSEAWLFYRTLPSDRSLYTKDILRFAGKNISGDLGRFVITGLLTSLLMFTPSIVVGILVDRALPAEDADTLLRMILLLVALSLVGALLQTLHGTALMRLEGRAAAQLAAAVWDRLLRVPRRFFTRFTAGDLGLRMTVFQTLRDQISGVVARATSSLVMLLPALGILFFYNATLAWLSLGVGVVALVVIVTLGFLQIAPHRRRYAAIYRLAGELFQFINGMAKIRSAGAEASAFASWARGYRDQHLAGIQAFRLNEHLIAFGAAVPALATATLFAAMYWQGTDTLSVGDFLVVFSASMVFYSAVAALGQSFEILAGVIPTYEQVAPILAETPNRPSTGNKLPDLRGEIRFDHVRFRYVSDGPLILEDVTIHIRPGEFAAIVGGSGTGKSTLLNLALGLLEPESGALYYDGSDLTKLDLRSLRSQIGVVVQDGSLQPGNILDNIIGTRQDLTIDDAWRAARLASVDDDIATMPMEMFTVIGDNSAIFSGGQTQRIRIAAALAHSPRIIFLDEATSWLDTRSQAKVMSGIEKLAVTRIVIAHRISTIRKADRIYVLEAGRVVQEGTFDELSAVKGPFLELTKRQKA